MTAAPLPDSPQPHVELRGVSKSFGGPRILTDITLAVSPGSVHGLVGENGAGKSSLSKIIAGLITADEGELFVGGEAVSFRSPREALAHGVATIAQELALVPGLTVAENVFLGTEPRRAGFVQRRALRARFDELVRETGFSLRADAVVGSLRTADQQKVEILRALASGASFIIMDEPTAALSGQDVKRLHDVIRSLAASGRTVLLISHFLSEVLELCDTVTILRDGHLVRTCSARDETESTLIEGMLGRSLSSVFPPKRLPDPDAAEVLRVENLKAPGVNGVSFTVRAGEIVGLAGLVGAGRSEIAHAVFGSSPRRDGRVTVNGQKAKRASVSRSLASGVFLIPESRKQQGLVLQRSIRENVTLSNLHGFSVASWVRRRAERRDAARVLREVTVQGDDRRAVAQLSGGNQQKVLFARALQRARTLLIADEPTRGVDIGSRRAIYDLLVEQAAKDVAVIVISSDVEEVLGLAHRVLVIRGGRIVTELTGDRMTEENILVSAFDETGAIAVPTAAEVK
jgi:simple sugar transport system ATP-binding protein/ribose transport system ATP-binding protein